MVRFKIARFILKRKSIKLLLDVLFLSSCVLSSYSMYMYSFDIRLLYLADITTVFNYTIVLSIIFGGLGGMYRIIFGGVAKIYVHSVFSYFEFLTPKKVPFLELSLFQYIEEKLDIDLNDFFEKHTKLIIFGFEALFFMIASGAFTSIFFNSKMAFLSMFGVNLLYILGVTYAGENTSLRARSKEFLPSFRAQMFGFRNIAVMLFISAIIFGYFRAVYVKEHSIIYMEITNETGIQASLIGRTSSGVLVYFQQNEEVGHVSWSKEAGMISFRPSGFLHQGEIQSGESIKN